MEIYVNVHIFIYYLLHALLRYNLLQDYKLRATAGISIPPCSKCGKTFRVDAKRRYHEKNCGEVSCEICGKSFKSKSNLNEHVAIHTDKYICHVCDRRCASQTKLNRHISTHNNDHRVTCSICGKTFSRKEHMLWHVNSQHK